MSVWKRVSLWVLVVSTPLHWVSVLSICGHGGEGFSLRFAFAGRCFLLFLLFSRGWLPRVEIGCGEFRCAREGEVEDLRETLGLIQIAVHSLKWFCKT